MSEKVYTLLELLEQYKNGTLPDDVVFKYQSVKGVYTIHRDELAREAILTNIYSKNHRDGLLGANVSPHKK